MVTQTAEDPNLGPLVATVNPATGAIMITHSDPETGAPVYNTNPLPATAGALDDLLDGQLFGIDKKLIALGLLAYVLLGRKL